MSKEAMKLALENSQPSFMSPGWTLVRNEDITALREALAEQPAQQEQESWEDLHNALQRIDTAAVGLPTFEVRHEGGLDAVTQNIVDAITALHVQPAQQEPVAWQPIETAPKKEVKILLRSFSGLIAEGYFLRAAYNGVGGWVWPYIHQNPVHWMPLPPPPIEAKLKEKNT